MQNENLDRYNEGDHDEVSVNNMNDENIIEFERRPSIMRLATARDVLTLEEQTMTDSQRIVHRRGCYKWLPSSGGNDMVVGSW